MNPIQARIASVLAVRPLTITSLQKVMRIDGNIISSNVCELLDSNTLGLVARPDWSVDIVLCCGNVEVLRDYSERVDP